VLAAGYQLCLYWELTATTTRTARKSCAHQRAAERVGEQGYQKNSVDCSSNGGAVREIWWVFCALHLSGRPVMGALGHQDQKCQKIVRTSTSSEKSRSIRLSNNAVDCSSDGGAVREIWWVFHALHLSARPVLGAYGHHHQKYQKIVRIYRRAAERVGEQGYQKILSIAVAMVA